MKDKINQISEDIESLNVLLNNLSEEKIYDTAKFKGEALDKYKELYNKFTKTNSSTNSTTIEKKETLETLVSYISDKTGFFKVYKNVRTSTNELDLLLQLTGTGKTVFSHTMPIGINEILLECKNYSKKIDVTWIGKFYSLLSVSKLELGIIFSYHGFTGKDWNDGVGLTKKIFLLDSTLILDFSKEDFEKLSQDICFLEIIKEKISNIKHDTNIEKYISKHPAQPAQNEK